MNLPGNSLDLNPIENTWKVLKEKVRDSHDVIGTAAAEGHHTSLVPGYDFGLLQEPV